MSGESQYECARCGMLWETTDYAGCPKCRESKRFEMPPPSPTKHMKITVTKIVETEDGNRFEKTVSGEFQDEVIQPRIEAADYGR